MTDFDDFWDSLEPLTAEDIDAIIGEPPEWYYPLVGHIAVAAGGLERRLAETALRLLGRPRDRLFHWLSAAPRLKKLLVEARGLSADFDALAAQLPAVSEQRNKAVHVATGWHDWDSPDEPSGWHYEHPRSGERVYLDGDAQARLMHVLATIKDLDECVWQLHVSLNEQG